MLGATRFGVKHPRMQAPTIPNHKTRDSFVMEVITMAIMAGSF